MKLKTAVTTAAALLLGSALAFAQSGTEPSESYVLDKAREAYQGSQAEQPQPPQPAPAPETPQAPYAPAAGGSSESDSVPRYPFVFTALPGLSLPFGEFDVDVQLGLVMATARDVNGLQAAFVFANARDVEGFQAAGVFANARRLSGFQASGVFNTASEGVEGFQGSGVFNTAAGDLDGFQGSGVFNTVAGDVEGYQGAGVFNVAGGRVSGAQMAGVANLAAGDVEGLQMAGVYNQARRVEGLQIGLVNVADDIEDGLQLGLVNIARNGVSGVVGYWEPDSDELGFAWQNGSRSLFTVLRVSAPRGDWLETSDSAIAAFGLGTRMGGRRGSPYLDLEASAAREIGPLLDHLADCAAREEWTEPSFSQRPYPSFRLSLGVPLAGRLHLLGGLNVDVDLADWPALPERRKAGSSFSDTWFGCSFTAYSRWFLGFRI